MKLREALKEGIVTADEITRAKRTLKVAGLGSAGASMILAEMATQKEASVTIGMCEAYLHLASIMLITLPANVLDSEVPLGNEGMFKQMTGARDHLRHLIK